MESKWNQNSETEKIDHAGHLHFYGILIKMFFDDHAPPHFHAEYAEFEWVVNISPIEVVRGEAPMRVLSMVLE